MLQLFSTFEATKHTETKDRMKSFSPWSSKFGTSAESNMDTSERRLWTGFTSEEPKQQAVGRTAQHTGLLYDAQSVFHRAGFRNVTTKWVLVHLHRTQLPQGLSTHRSFRRVTGVWRRAVRTVRRSAHQLILLSLRHRACSPCVLLVHTPQKSHEISWLRSYAKLSQSLRFVSTRLKSTQLQTADDLCQSRVRFRQLTLLNTSRSSSSSRSNMCSEKSAGTSGPLIALPNFPNSPSSWDSWEENLSRTSEQQLTPTTHHDTSATRFQNKSRGSKSDSRGWEGYFGNVIEYRLLVTLF